MKGRDHRSNLGQADLGSGGVCVVTGLGGVVLSAAVAGLAALSIICIHWKEKRSDESGLYVCSLVRKVHYCAMLSMFVLMSMGGNTGDPRKDGCATERLAVRSR